MISLNLLNLSLILEVSQGECILVQLLKDLVKKKTLSKCKELDEFVMLGQVTIAW